MDRCDFIDFYEKTVKYLRADFVEPLPLREVLPENLYFFAAEF